MVLLKIYLLFLVWNLVKLVVCKKDMLIFLKFVLRILWCIVDNDYML